VFADDSASNEPPDVPPPDPIVRLYVAVWLPELADPFTEMEYVPAAAELVVASFIVELAPAVTDVGLNDTVTPDGAPDADNDTVCALPDVTAVFTVADVELPAVTDPDDGDNDTEKSLLTLPPPLVNGSKVWLKYQVDCEMPEQLSCPPVPGQLPLSRCKAQNEISAIPFDFAQFSTVVASDVVNVSAEP